MTALDIAARLRNHVAPSRAEMAAYADEVEALAVEVLAAGNDLVGWLRKHGSEPAFDCDGCGSLQDRVDRLTATLDGA